MRTFAVLIGIGCLVTGFTVDQVSAENAPALFAIGLVLMVGAFAHRYRTAR